MSESAAGQFPLGRSEKINVAVQRPTVNLKEAENLAEEAASVTHQGGTNPFKKSGWGGGHVHNMWDKD
jgi:hypothetical protein